MASVGAANELFVVMKDGKPVAIVAKDPNRAVVTDITEELARLFRDALAKAGAA